MRIILFCLFVCLISNSVDAQRLSHSSGTTFELTESESIFFLGQYKDQLIYKISSLKLNEKKVNEVKNSIIHVNANSLQIVETLDLYALGYQTMIELHQMINGQLYLFFAVSEIEDLQVKSYTVKSVLIDLNKGLSNRQEKVLVNFLGGKRPDFNYSETRSLFEIQAGYNKNYFDLQLSEVKFAEEGGGPSGSNLYRDKNRYFAEQTETELSKQAIAYFYPLAGNNNIYVESVLEYNPDSYGSRRASYRDIGLSLFDAKTETKVMVYSLPLKHGKYILEYDAHFMPDSNILVLGIYQEGSIKSDKIKFGVFSMVFDLSLMEKSKLVYQEMFESSPEKITENPSYSMLFNNGYPHYFDQTSLEHKQTYSFKYLIENPNVPNEYTYLKIDKTNNQVKFNRLRNFTYHQNTWTEFSGFYEVKLNDTSSLLLFNDHPQNTGRDADSIQGKPCRVKVGEAVFSYVLYTIRNGFSERFALIPSDKEKFFMALIRYEDVVELKTDKKGKREWVFPAYDEGKMNSRFYKIQLSF